MGGGGEQSQLEQQPQPSAAAASTKPASAEEEFLKRNTDCVYFLASPLTCKKGAECEYRHSDAARVNPRDCWYWLNGNCLNPKCAFRHPPLDGLLGTQVQTPVGSSQPPMQTAVVPVASAPGKQAVPCIFFQKGYCLKGHLCPFMHAPAGAVNNKVPYVAASDPPAFKKVFGGLDKCNQEQKISQENFKASVELHPPQTKPQVKVEAAGSRKDIVNDRHTPLHLDLNEWPPRYKPTNVPPATNGNSMGRSSRAQQVDRAAPNMQQQVHGVDHGVLNNKDTDEFSREPSPGFDVLVEDDLRDADYYHNESNYGGTRDHEGKIQNSVNDYDMVHQDYNSMGDVERDLYREPRDYDSYGPYSRNHRRGSSERVSGGSSSHLERRRNPRSDSPDRMNESDLRHRLSKQKRVNNNNNGLRSVISHDRSRDKYGEDRSFRGPSRRDAHNLPSSEVSVSSRLRGRIKLPGRSSSPVNGTDFHHPPEREMDRGRNRSRLSPIRSHNSAHPGRLRDRMTGRVVESNNTEDRSFRGPRIRDAIGDSNNVGFSGPRSLAQLKGGKISENNEQQVNGQPSSLGKRKFPPLEGHKQGENDISFEGPKPLSEILKRKKSAAIPPKEDREATDVPNLESAKNDEEELKVGGTVPTEESKSADDGSKSGGDQSRRLERNVSEVETEEGMIVDEELEDQEDPEAFDQVEDGGYDYEQVDGEDYNLEEGENLEGEEYIDEEEDDGDDFAKKIGVMFS